MEEIFKLVSDSISHESVETLKTLTQDAEAGHLMGFAIAAIYKKGSFKVRAVGESTKSPIFAIGTVVILLYRLIKRAVQ